MPVLQPAPEPVRRRGREAALWEPLRKGKAAIDEVDHGWVSIGRLSSRRPHWLSPCSIKMNLSTQAVTRLWVEFLTATQQ